MHDILQAYKLSDVQGAFIWQHVVGRIQVHNVYASLEGLEKLLQAMTVGRFAGARWTDYLEEQNMLHKRLPCREALRGTYNLTERHDR